MLATNRVFEGLKSELTALSDFMGKEKLYNDFHGYLALITADREAHAWGNDYDKNKITSRVRYPKDWKDYSPDKNGIDLDFKLSQVPVTELGLAPINDRSFNDCCFGYYQDEMSNIEGYASSRDILGVRKCNCFICRLKVKPKELWEPLDSKVAEETVKFIMGYLESNEVKPITVNITRTPDELKALEVKIREEYSKKSMDFTDDLMKSKPTVKEEHKETEKEVLLKSLKTKAEELMKLKKGKQMDDMLFKSEVKLWEIKDTAEQPMEDFCKAVKRTGDCVDFSKR